MLFKKKWIFYFLFRLHFRLKNYCRSITDMECSFECKESVVRKNSGAKGDVHSASASSGCVVLSLLIWQQGILLKNFFRIIRTYFSMLNFLKNASVKQNKALERTSIWQYFTLNATESILYEKCGISMNLELTTRLPHIIQYLPNG